MFKPNTRSNIKKALTLASLFFILFPSFTFAAENTASSHSGVTGEAPIVNEIIVTKNTRLIRPIIAGTVEKDVKVLVYVDGIYSGDAIQEDLNEEKNTFQFQSKDYYKTGEHKVFALAQNKENLEISTSSNEVIFETLKLSAPTLVELIEKEGSDYTLTGLSQSNTKVEFYLDEKIIGTTENLVHDSGTANFAFKFSSDLKKGNHQILAIATDQSGFKSNISNRIKFTVDSDLPAPVLLDPITTNNKATVVGLVKNDLDVKLFVNGKEVVLIKIDNHESGTANFAYELEKKQETQEIKVRAIKRSTASSHSGVTGEESKFSKSIIVNKRKAVSPKISERAVTEDLAQEETPSVKGVEKTFTENKNTEAGEIIFNIESPQEINQEIKVTNEAGENQFKLSLNLVIFILFLLSVIVWIFWVNKELIKERKEAEKKKDIAEASQEEEKEQENKTEPNK